MSYTERDIYYKVKSKKEFDIIVTVAKSVDLRVCEEFISSWNRYETRSSYPYAKIKKSMHNPEKILVGSPCVSWRHDVTLENNRSFISELSDFLTAVMEHDKHAPKNVLKLTDSYNAEILVKDQVVKVGCQIIPFEAVKNLYDLMEKLKIEHYETILIQQQTLARL